jgi:hypothetical protein
MKTRRTSIYPAYKLLIESCRMEKEAIKKYEVLDSPALNSNQERVHTMSKPYIRLDKNKAAVLLVDHQTGLLSLVRDIDPDKFKNNVLALADR